MSLADDLTYLLFPDPGQYLSNGMMRRMDICNGSEDNLKTATNVTDQHQVD